MILMTLIIMAMANLFSKPNISVFVLLPLLFPSRVSRMWDLSFECKTNQTHFTNKTSYHLTLGRKSTLFQKPSV